MAKTTGGSTSTSYQEQKGGSASNTTSGSTSNTHSSTDSYSNSHTEGGSHSTTTGETWGQSQSVGGSKSQGKGVSWASGEVADRTQEKFNQATEDYVRSQKVDDAYANLQSALNARPAFQSKFEDKLNDMYDKIMNREAFSYDFNKDAMYQQYKDMYQTQGKRAMQDTMGQLAALNSGYGSSYSQTAGQQAYQNYLEELNNRIPELRQQALDEYDREGNRLMQQYNLTNDAYNREYGQYRNDVTDWQADRSFDQSAYQDERNFDYQQAMNDRNFWQNEYWQERNSAQSNLNEQEAANWNQSESYSKSRSETDTRSWSDTSTTSHSDTNSTTNTTGWSNTLSNNWSTTNGTTNTNSWSNSPGSGSGGSGNAVQFSEDNSMGGVFTPQSRSAIVNDVSELARQVNTAQTGQEKGKAETALSKYLLDLYKNGSRGTNGETVQYSVEDLTNIYNRGLTKDIVANGSRNGAQTLTPDEMRRKLGIPAK